MTIWCAWWMATALALILIAAVPSPLQAEEPVEGLQGTKGGVLIAAAGVALGELAPLW